MRIRSRAHRPLLTMAGAVALALAAVVGSAAPAHAADILPIGAYSLTGQGIEVLEPLSGGINATRGTPVVVGNRVDEFNDPAVAQRRWFLALPLANGTYQFLHASGLCLNIEGASTSPSARLILWDCDANFTNEQFRLSHPDPVRPRAFQITAAHSNRPLGLPAVGGTVRQNGTSGTAKYFFPVNDSVCFLCGLG